MKICGLVAEYNPFHNGHVHHMEEARKLTGCDYIIVVMSGDYVQRGTPAVIDKYERTAMALDGGADLVLEIPTLFSTASAETFATAAMSLLTQLGCVDSVCFGTELGDLAPLKKIAEILNNEPDSFKEHLRDNIRTGMNYARARSAALQQWFGDEIPNLSEILETSNNILGIEYLRALDRLGSSITPFTVHRWTTEYHSMNTYDDTASATFVRNKLYEDGGIEAVTPFVTPYTAREFAIKYGISTPVRADDFSMLLQYRLVSEKDRLTDYLDFTPEIAERIRNLLPDVCTFREWSGAIKSKSYTHTRINRALLHLILNIKEKDLDAYVDEDYCMYARILGFRKDSLPLLSIVKDSTPLPLISKMADAKKILSPKAMRLLSIDIFGAEIYRNVVYQKFGTQLKDEFTQGIVKM